MVPAARAGLFVEAGFAGSGSLSVPIAAAVE
jgi:hypothetical protein